MILWTFRLEVKEQGDVNDAHKSADSRDAKTIGSNEDQIGLISGNIGLQTSLSVNVAIRRRILSEILIASVSAAAIDESAVLRLSLLIDVRELTAIRVRVHAARIRNSACELLVVVEVVLVREVAAVGRLLLEHERVEDAPVLGRVDAAAVECAL